MVLSAEVGSDAEPETFDPAETRADAPALLTESHLAAIGPALDATTATLGQAPALWQVYVSTDLANVTVQVPHDPGELDEYTWMDGGLSRPTAREMFIPDADDPEDYLFTRADVSPETIAGAIATVPELDPITSGDDVQIYPTAASLAYDMVEEDLTITVHASENVVDSEHRWVITFDLNGELVSTFESVTEELTRFD